ncbi:MAG: hypothetical protein LBG87_04280 [Spirochaetaceae bacterium]|nr:hypothetical protein [Spirochaetaceae bacterium]
MEKTPRNMRKILPYSAVLWLAVVPTLQAQTGDKAMAERYALWARNAIAEERWTDALAALERGADFSNVSSDIDYLLGLARFHENYPLGAVLEAVNRSIETNRWSKYAESHAKLLRATALIRIRRYAEALADIAGLPQSVDAVCLKLRAFRGLNDREAFANTAAQGMDAYPRDPRPVRLFFEYAADRLPLAGETDLMALALKRLPLLVQTDPELAYLGGAFIPDPDEARRVLGAYRAIPSWNPASIPSALNLGILDGNDAIDELFASSIEEKEKTGKKLDKKLLLSVWNFLRDDAQRERFRERLLYFTGLITEDADNDGYAETAVRYTDGIISGYAYDADQDGLPELSIFFDAGVPVRMNAAASPFPGKGPQAYPPRTAEELAKTTLHWERYPAVLQTTIDGVSYIPKPFDFFVFPVYFTKLESGGLLYPERNPSPLELSHQNLLRSSLYIEKPSREFPGGLEVIALDQGIPQKAWETLAGKLVSETVFHLGAPVTQKIDLDGNGYMETVRTFAPAKTAGKSSETGKIAASKSDWNEDGLFEYEEQYVYQDDSFAAIRFWDADRNGTREFSDQLLQIRLSDQ